MKKIISTLMVIAAAAMLFSSCSKQEMTTPEASQEVTLTFASEKPAFADETKTEWTGETIQWSAGDKISVAYTVNGKWQNASGDASGDAKLYKSEALKDASSTAQFNVSASFKGETEGAHVFYGVYPAPESTNIPNAPEVSVEVPALQTLKSDTFDCSADLMTGISVNDFSARPAGGETISMEWTRLVAHAFITIKTLNGATDGEKVSNITLTAQADANIVGMQKVNLVTNEITKDNTNANVLNLSGGNVFVDAEGTIYVWACILPETLTSLIVKVDTDKATYTRVITDISKTFKQNARNLLTINMSNAERVEKVVDPEENVITGTLTFDDTSKRIVSTTDQQVWSENNITLTYDKAGYTNNLAEYVKPVRFYKGTTITVEAPGNISVIEFACNTTSYAEALNSSISGSTLNGKVVTITLDGDARSVTYTMGAQVRMDALTVTYSKSGETPDTTPSITVKEILKLTSAESEGTIDVTYKNLAEFAAAAYSDAECTIESDWLEASWVNDAVSYTASANDGGERTAYIQISAVDAESNEYSEIITVIQDAYVDPSITQELTVEEFLNLKNESVEYILTGKITRVVNTTYGNFDLTDATGTVYIYGLLTPEGDSQKQWAAAGLKQGDIITIKGKYSEYESAPQVKNAVYVSHKGINVDKSALEFAAEGGSLDVTAKLVNATDAISVSVDNPHFTVALKSGTTYTVTAPANETDEAIYANLKFTAGDLTAVVTITQEKSVVEGEVAGGRDDFNTVAANSSYGSRTTKAGWSGTNCAVMQGGTSDSNPTFTFIGSTNATRAFTMNGKTNAKGKITSPTLTTGCGKLSLKYGNAFSESNGVDFTVTIKQNGTVVKEYKVDVNSVSQKRAYTWEQDVNVTGDFVIEITNNSPSNNSTSNKDRVSIWDIEWTGYN